MAAGDWQRKAEALLRRRRPVTAEDVAAEMEGADLSELRRFVAAKLRADDIEADELPALVLVAMRAGLGPARKDVEAVALDERRPEIARQAAWRILEACDALAHAALRARMAGGDRG